ncbi:hypothetical protein SEA_EMIANNA_79 [Gordonia phage Emianna]|uniref:Uncharacterized protein n=1 Tax=Gordonia phage Emianna TaxID=2315530 RepID=A0A386KEY2_9CAUD|nr:hypothetical protein KNU15_gp79 [Gordonia phage Emianna]AYD83479.1 hypothetical protein SEA_EMIANNA_79 [Gordonia phage Emianna]AYD84351.1 hypothetical protein SEA_KURT_79 [Gordonia phage Kurt]
MVARVERAFDRGGSNTCSIEPLFDWVPILSGRLPVRAVPRDRRIGSPLARLPWRRRCA